MKYVKYIFPAVVSLLISGLITLLLLNSPAVILLNCRADKAADLKFYPSKMMDRKIGKKAYVGHLREGDARTVKVTIPLSCLRKLRIEIPPEVQIEFIDLKYEIFGLFCCSVPINSFLSSAPHNTDEIIRILDPDTGQISHIRVQTGKTAGWLEVKLANDFPRFLALLLGVLSGLASFIFFFLFIRIGSGTRNAEKLLTAAFLVLIFAGSVSMAISTRVPKSPLPQLDILDLTDYPDRFSSWFQNNLPYRKHFIAVYRDLCLFFHVSPVDKVIIGRDGWLFLHHNKNDNAYDTYLGNNLFTPQELHRILEKLKEIQTRLKKKNIRFVCFISPSKLSVYDDMLRPEWRRKDSGGMTRAIQLYDFIRKNSDIPIEFPLQEMIAARKSVSQPIYYKGDTHWNHLGGYVGARAMMKLIDPDAAGKMPDLASHKFSFIFSGKKDLRWMLNLPDEDSNDSWCIQDSEIQYDRYSSVSDSGCYSFAGECRTGKRVFFIRDSFFTGMAPFLARHLSYFACYWDFSLNMGMIESEKPDIVVLEIVERYLGVLLKFPEVTWKAQRGGRMM